MGFLSKLLTGYIQAIPDITVDADIKHSRNLHGWNEVESEIFDQTCVHLFDFVITEDGHVEKCIYCGATR